jgi:hypothetical protein
MRLPIVSAGWQPHRSFPRTGRAILSVMTSAAAEAQHRRIPPVARPGFGQRGFLFRITNIF